jgi:hypothetical protein
MVDPAPAAPPSPAPSPAPAVRPGSLTGVSYDAPTDAQYDRLPVSEQGRYARVRDASNNPTWQPRSDLAPDANPVAPKPAAAPGEPAAPAVGEKVRVGQYETSESEIADLLKFKADRLAAQVGVPPAAQDYVIKTPADWRAIDGVEFQIIDANAPAFADLKNWAHKNSIPQSEVETLVGLYASYEAQKEAAFRAAVQREKEALGERGTMRIDAMHSWLRSVIQDDDLTGAVMQGLWSSKQVLALEKIASKFTTQGAAPFSQAHRAEPAVPGRVSDEEYSRMSQADRWAYARSHDQKQFYPGGNGGER